MGHTFKGEETQLVFTGQLLGFGLGKPLIPRRKRLFNPSTSTEVLTQVCRYLELEVPASFSPLQVTRHVPPTMPYRGTNLGHFLGSPPLQVNVFQSLHLLTAS